MSKTNNLSEFGFSRSIIDRGSIFSHQINSTQFSNFVDILKSDRTDNGVEKVLKFLNDNNTGQMEIRIKILEEKIAE